LQGLISGVIGGASGGISGGIDAALDGRRFWDGATVTRTYAAKVDVTKVVQNGDNNCLPATGESVNKDLGGKIKQDVFRQAVGGDPNNDPIRSDKFWNMFSEKTGLTVEYPDNNSLLEVLVDKGMSKALTTLNEGGRAVMSIPSGTAGVGHMVSIQSVYLETVTSLKGNVTTNVFYRVMNPATGGFQNINVRNLVYNYCMSICR
jgi:hypothetical protein